MKIFRRRWVGVFVGSFDEFAGFESVPSADEGNEVGGGLTARQRPWAASMSLNAASPVARDPGPRVIFATALGNFPP
jgi:hypothetical protein